MVIKQRIGFFGEKQHRDWAMRREVVERRGRSWPKRGITQVSLFFGKVYLTKCSWPFGPNGSLQTTPDWELLEGRDDILFISVFSVPNTEIMLNRCLENLTEPLHPCFPLLYWSQLEQKQINKQTKSGGSSSYTCNAISQTPGKTPS